MFPLLFIFFPFNSYPQSLFPDISNHFSCTFLSQLNHLFFRTTLTSSPHTLSSWLSYSFFSFFISPLRVHSLPLSVSCNRQKCALTTWKFQNSLSVLCTGLHIAPTRPQQEAKSIETHSTTEDNFQSQNSLGQTQRQHKTTPNSTTRSPSSEANSGSASTEISSSLWNTIITEFTEDRQRYPTWTQWSSPLIIPCKAINILLRGKASDH